MSLNKNTRILAPIAMESIFKKKAKRLRDELSIPLMEAQNRLAESIGLGTWNNLHEIVESSRPIEEAYRWGLVIAIDPSCASLKNNTPFVSEPLLNLLALEDRRLSKAYQKEWKRLGEPYLLKDPEVRETLDEMISGLAMFRYTGIVLPADVDVVMELWNKSCMWEPLFVWLKGELTVID